MTVLSHFLTVLPPNRQLSETLSYKLIDRLVYEGIAICGQPLNYKAIICDDDHCRLFGSDGVQHRHSAT